MPRPAKSTKKAAPKANRTRLLFCVSLIVLFLSFSVNIFGLGPATFFNAYQKDSEALVVNEVRCNALHGRDLFGGMLVSQGGFSTNHNDYVYCGQKVFAGYVSQFNIQGKVISLFAPHNINQVEIYLKVVKILLTALLAAALSYLIVLVKREFSATAAITLLIGLSLSNWLVYVARNLYWVPILLLAPFIFSFAFYQKFKDARRQLLFFTILSFLVMLKALAGYEYIACVVLSSFVPILYYEVKSHGKIDLRALLLPFLKTMLAGGLGFLIAAALHVTQLSLYFHSLSHGLAVFQNRATDRTFGEPGDDIIVNLIPQSQYLEPDLYNMMDKLFHIPTLSSSSPLFIPSALLVQVVIFLFLPLYSLPFLLKQHVTTILESVAFTLAATTAIAWFWNKYRLLRSSPKHLALLSAAAFSFLSSASWFIVAHPHAIHHLHLAAISYYIPYAIIFYILLGTLMDSWLAKLMAVFYEKNLQK